MWIREGVAGCFCCWRDEDDDGRGGEGESGGGRGSGATSFRGYW